LSDVCVSYWLLTMDSQTVAHREITRFSKFALGKSGYTIKPLSENSAAGNNAYHKFFRDRILSFCSLLYVWKV